ncbi:hypothetical protein [Nostoc sp. TCL240-02]|uniref:hypothetical protein n=1 Tax=Nostoc sp. TCL240-02 TaxID=2572090 RepID=UPI00157F8043|nr:hypothetical protein [Nostoc sp. TCL240-02]QKQ73139.1 hypothetical protein FBB35_06870 [Nostoc sp. TCL240-02]
MILPLGLVSGGLLFSTSLLITCSIRIGNECLSSTPTNDNAKKGCQAAWDFINELNFQPRHCQEVIFQTRLRYTLKVSVIKPQNFKNLFKRWNDEKAIL